MKIKKNENIEQEKNRILEAAYRCFVKKGYADTSVNDIVTEYGKSKGNLVTTHHIKRFSQSFDCKENKIV